MWPFSGIQTIHCDLHDCDIKVYPIEEQDKFIDDNSPDIIVFKGIGLKRYIDGKCDINCQTVLENI
jgi:hypothetical protein